MNLVVKIFIAFLASSFALIALYPDSIATALIPPTLCAGFCFDLFLKSRREQRTDNVDAQLKAFKERLDMLTIQKGMSR